MLTYDFSGIKGSMYAHLYACIKNDIRSGQLHPAEKLPSKRMLAKHLGVSLITVENAYAQLLVEGYIFSRPKRGYFVAQLPRQEQLPPLPPSKINANAAAPEKKPAAAYFADFAGSSVPPESFPYNIWARLLRRTLTVTDEHELLGDTSAAGVLPLRQALAEYLYQFRGVVVAPEQIIIGAGTQTLYNILVQLLGRSRIYALEDPGYPRLAQVYASNDVFCRYLPMDDKGIRADILARSDADILHITPSHQFPTGIVMPVQRRYELLQWAGQSGSRYIIEDDYDCEFRHYGRPIPSLQSIDRQEKVIYINTFSKTLAPTFRISYMLLPPHLAQLFHKKLGFYSCTVSNLEQFTLAEFIRQGYLERHINRMRTYYRNKRDALLEHIARSSVAASLKIEGEDSGLHFLLHLKTLASDGELIRAARAAGINVRFLSQYYRQPLNDFSHTMLMNYAGQSSERLLPALDKLFEALAPYLG